MTRQGNDASSSANHDDARGAQLDPQLGKAARLFDEMGMPYWLDAGSLLSLVREKRLFMHDKDVDIGVWAENLDRIEPALSRLEDEGHRVARETWQAKTFKFKIYPRHGEEGRVIDLQVYRRSGDHAWSPVHTVGNYDYNWYNLPLLLRGAVRWPWRMWLAHKAKDVEVTRFPWNRMGWLGTWWIPATHFEATDRDNPEGLPFPRQKERYLAYRYGNWQKPQKGWVYWKDDGAYRPVPPQRLLRP